MLKSNYRSLVGYLPLRFCRFFRYRVQQRCVLWMKIGSSWLINPDWNLLISWTCVSGIRLSWARSVLRGISAVFHGFTHTNKQCQLQEQALVFFNTLHHSWTMAEQMWCFKRQINTRLQVPELKKKMPKKKKKGKIYNFFWEHISLTRWEQINYGATCLWSQALPEGHRKWTSYPPRPLFSWCAWFV